MKKFLILMMTMCMSFFMFGQEVETIEQTSFSQSLLGMETQDFFVALIWAYLGALLNIVSDVTKRKKPSTNSPVNFSISYWMRDNWRRIIVTVILIPVAIVGCVELFSVQVTQFIAFSIGFGSDHIMEIVKRKGVIKGAVSQE